MFKEKTGKGILMINCYNHQSIICVKRKLVDWHAVWDSSQSFFLSGLWFLNYLNFKYSFKLTDLSGGGELQIRRLCWLGLV